MAERILSPAMLFDVSIATAIAAAAPEFCSVTGASSPFSLTVKSGAGPGSGVCTVTETAGNRCVSTDLTTMLG